MDDEIYDTSSSSRTPISMSRSSLSHSKAGSTRPRREQRNRHDARHHLHRGARHVRHRVLHRPARPATIARIVDGITTELTWPEINCASVETATARTILFLVVPSRTSTGATSSTSSPRRRRFDVRLVVGLGAFPAPTPQHPSGAHHRHGSGHQCPSARAGGTVSGELEVPAGISSALELGFAEVDMEIVTLWARVPHYVASMPYPQASAALIDGLRASPD